jgi:hypothetical protein
MSSDQILPGPNSLTLDNFCSATFKKLDTKSLMSYLAQMGGRKQKQKGKVLTEIKRILHERRGNTSLKQCTYGCYECTGEIAKIKTASGVEFIPTSIWTTRSTKNAMNPIDLKSLALKAETDNYLMNIVYKSRYVQDYAQT